MQARKAGVIMDRFIYRISIGILILCIVSSVFASPQAVYQRITRANGFWVYPILVVRQSPRVQAGNRGVYIYITTGMIKFVKNEHELAVVLGHELAHGKLWHKKSNYLNEYAADKLGAQYAYKAGYNICIGVKILKRFGRKASKTHPSGISRYDRLRC